eukprot:755114-Hanusia_phi.AAC.1
MRLQAKEMLQSETERRMKELRSKCERAEEGPLLGELSALKDQLGRKEEEKELAMQKAAAEFEKERSRLQRMIANAQNESKSAQKIAEAANSAKASAMDSSKKLEIELSSAKREVRRGRRGQGEGGFARGGEGGGSRNNEKESARIKSLQEEVQRLKQQKEMLEDQNGFLTNAEKR